MGASVSRDDLWNFVAGAFPVLRSSRCVLQSGQRFEVVATENEIEFTKWRNFNTSFSQRLKTEFVPVSERGRAQVDIVGSVLSLRVVRPSRILRLEYDINEKRIVLWQGSRHIVVTLRRATRHYRQHTLWRRWRRDLRFLELQLPWPLALNVLQLREP